MIADQKIAADDVGLPASVPLSENLRAGLAALSRAHTLDQDAHVEPWEFALEIDELYKTGLVVSELRWLVAKGLAEHGEEQFAHGESQRAFVPGIGLTFHSATCVILTPNGAAFAEGVADGSAISAPPMVFVAATSICPDRNTNGKTVSGDIDPHTRLHDAIYKLNGHQTNELLRFHGNGTADGILWNLL